MVWHHPAIRQKHIGSELDSYHFRIHLDNDPLQPAADPRPTLLVIAKYFNNIPNIKRELRLRRFHKWHRHGFSPFPNSQIVASVHSEEIQSVGLRGSAAQTNTLNLF
jgi:hypothetical protein